MKSDIKVGTIWTIGSIPETRIVIDKVEDYIVYFSYKTVPQTLIEWGVVPGRRGERYIEDFLCQYKQIYTIEGFEL